MKSSLWETIISESPYNGVSIPYMVGKYYNNGRVPDLQTSDCIRIVLEDIVNTVQPDNEAAIFPCNSYAPFIPMIQFLRCNRSTDDLKQILTNNPRIKNSKGEIVIYLQEDWKELHSLEDLTRYFWNKYGEHIKQGHFSVRRTAVLQPDNTYHIWGDFADNE